MKKKREFLTLSLSHSKAVIPLLKDALYLHIEMQTETVIADKAKTL